MPLIMSDDSIDRLGLLIHDAARLMRKRFEARASGHGLSSAQWRLLVRAAKEPGVAQARLAELLEIEPISVSRLVDRMEEAGWIKARMVTTEHNRRARAYDITAAGRRQLGLEQERWRSITGAVNYVLKHA